MYTVTYRDVSSLTMFRIDHTQVNENLLSIHAFRIRSSALGHTVSINKNLSPILRLTTQAGDATQLEMSQLVTVNCPDSVDCLR